MTAYDARLQIEGEDNQPLPVVIDLTGDRLSMSLNDQEVADWAKEEMRVQALPDGFHIRVDGEAIVLDVTDDAQFALELGLRNAHPALRRRMSALMRDDV
jgi:hypothetical protein